MAYAAVLSLNQNLEQISNPHLELHQTPLQDQQIKFLQEKLSFLLDFLDDSWQRRSEELRCLEREIRDAAYKAEDMVESHISKNFGEESFQERQRRDQTFCVNFKIVADEIDCIKTKAAKFKELWGATDVHRSQRSPSFPTGQSSLLSIGKNDMVGFREDFLKVMDRLTGYPRALTLIPVTGMGGIGKTTLARYVYDHPQIEHHFHTRAWVKISQEYREREVLLSLLDSMNQFSVEKDEGNGTEKDEENSTEVLKVRLYKSLKGRRYLVVMDDVWTTEACNSLRRIFPDDGIGSRIMLTTRLSSVVDSPYSSYYTSHHFLHRLQFLNEIESWSLLCQKVFEEDSCPIELEEAGKEIAENCRHHDFIKEPETEIIARLESNDDTLQLEATTLFWKILLFDRDHQIQPIKEVIPRVVPRFLEFLGRDDYSQLQFEAARAITGISFYSYDNINILIDHGAVPILMSLLNSPEDVLRKEALQMLGNFAFASTKFRDLVLSYGVLMPLLEQLNDKTKLSIMRQATKTLSYLCRGEPWPQFEQVKSALLHLAHLIHTKDEEVLINACMALRYLTDRTKDIIQAVIDAGGFPRLVELLQYPSSSILYPALRTVHNIIKTGDDIQIQVIIDNGTLPCLLNLLTQNYGKILKKVTCWIIACITKDHFQAVIEAGIIAPLVKLLQNADFWLQHAAAWAIFSATMEGTNEQIKFLVDEGFIKPSCDLLVILNGVDIIKYCLGSLENILKVGEAEKNQGNTENVNVFAQMIDDAGGLQKIKNLQTYDDSEICKEAVKILETYWQEEDDEQLHFGDAPQSG